MQPALQLACELNGLVEMDEVPRTFDQHELRARDRVSETVRLVQREPAVIATPNDEHGKFKA
jgi:hypothetical protein